MKTSLLLFFNFLFWSSTLFATQPDTVLIFHNGKILRAETLVEGPVSYYCSSQLNIRPNRIGITTVYQEKEVVERFFLGIGREVEELTQTNYKDLIIQYLPNAPELHKRLGKRGFRFENVPYMIEFYNKFKTPNLTNTGPEERLLSKTLFHN